MGLSPCNRAKPKLRFEIGSSQKAFHSGIQLTSSGAVPLNQMSNILTRGYYIIILKKFFQDSIEGLFRPGLVRSSPC